MRTKASSVAFSGTLLRSSLWPPRRRAARPAARKHTRISSLIAAVAAAVLLSVAMKTQHAPAAESAAVSWLHHPPTVQHCNTVTAVLAPSAALHARSGDAVAGLHVAATTQIRWFTWRRGMLRAAGCPAAGPPGISRCRRRCAGSSRGRRRAQNAWACGRRRPPPLGGEDSRCICTCRRRRGRFARACHGFFFDGAADTPWWPSGAPRGFFAPSAFFGRRECVPLPLGASSPSAGGFWPLRAPSAGGRPSSALAVVPVGRPRSWAAAAKGASPRRPRPELGVLRLEARLFAEAVLLGLGRREAEGMPARAGAAG